MEGKNCCPETMQGKPGDGAKEGRKAEAKASISLYRRGTLLLKGLQEGTSVTLEAMRVTQARPW